MLPKIEARIDFVRESNNSSAIITSLDKSNGCIRRKNRYKNHKGVKNENKKKSS